jgi:hypothetical protein
MQRHTNGLPCCLAALPARVESSLKRVNVAGRHAVGRPALVVAELYWPHSLHRDVSRRASCSPSESEWASSPPYRARPVLATQPRSWGLVARKAWRALTLILPPHAFDNECQANGHRPHSTPASSPRSATLQPSKRYLPRTGSSG